MKLHLWLATAALVAATPFAARANVTLDRSRQDLSQGVQFVINGQWGDAEKRLREALRFDPTLSEAHYNLGVALRHQGRLDESIAQYHEALGGFTREEDRAKAFYGAALAKEARGDRDAWDEYLAFGRPLRDEQPGVRIALDHRDLLNGVRVPGTQKATR
jgi:tetratricopeptide (TPR) repeat protein